MSPFLFLVGAMATSQAGLPVGPPVHTQGVALAAWDPARQGGHFDPNAVDGRVAPVAYEAEKSTAPEPMQVEAPLLPPPVTPPAAAAPAPAAAASPPRYWVMSELQGTWLGSALDGHRTSISGWLQPSYTFSTARQVNQPVVWNDWANMPLLQQAWFRFDMATVTSGTTDVTYGYRVDVLAGSDYRWTITRGFWNAQLLNSRVATGPFDTQNIYGVDMPQYYVNAYIPNLFQGTDIRVGHLFTPWGYESIEGVSCPLVTRSYAFNWCPPFTHMGVMVSPTFNKQWSGKFMLANGNDVFIDPSQEARAVGAITYVSESGRDNVTFGYTLGRGKFNAADPFAPVTVGLMSENAGRNNINVLDLVWNHTFNPKMSYGMELIYGYQTNVPASFGNTPIVGQIIDNKAAAGVAHWGSLVHYLFYNCSPQLTLVGRFETFDDFEGQRTGFEGLYTALTVGAQYKPHPWLTIRPELRFDYNGYNRPFDAFTPPAKHELFTASIDALIRF